MVMTEKERVDKYKIILDYMQTEPFVTAREIAEYLEITSQSASGLLRGMENRNLVLSKAVKAGRNELKCYFLEAL